MALVISKEAKAAYYRARYIKGSVLKLMKPLKDPYSPKPVGALFTVDYVDDAGQIHGRWEDGSAIALIPEIDTFEIVEDDEG